MSSAVSRATTPERTKIHPFASAVVNAVIGALALWFVFSVWWEDQDLLDVAMASTGAAVVSLVPVVGVPLSALVMLGLLYWRCTASVQILAAAVMTASFLKLLALMALASLLASSK